MYLNTVHGTFYRVGPIALAADGTASMSLLTPDEAGVPVPLPIHIPQELVAGGLNQQAVLDWVISAEGPQAGGVYRSDEEHALDLAKAAAFAAVKKQRNAIEAAGVTTPYGTFDTDPQSQAKITGAVVMAMNLGAQFDIVWRLADNSVVQLDAAQMIEVGILIGSAVARYQSIKNVFDSRINAATTIEEVEALDVGQDWSLLDPTTM